jgi:hypothetical protein
MIDSLMGPTPGFANLRCRDGDIALVVKETPICNANVGKLVRVRGPAKTVILTQMPGWQIKPLHRRLWSVEKLNGRFLRELVNWDSCVFHEDAWLLPLRSEIPAKGLADTKGRLSGRLASLPQRAKAGQFIAAECVFDFAQLDPGTRFFDWEDMPITTNADMNLATAWTPIPSPRNPSDVRNKAGEVTRVAFANLFFCKAYAWAHWPAPYALQCLMEKDAQ